MESKKVILVRGAATVFLIAVAFRVLVGARRHLKNLDSKGMRLCVSDKTGHYDMDGVSFDEVAKVVVTGDARTIGPEMRPGY